MPSTAIRQSVEALRRQLLVLTQQKKQLDLESHKVHAALSALAAVDTGEVVARRKQNGKSELSIEAPSRTYSYGFTAKCSMCNNEFATARIIKNKKVRLHQYCHNPCDSGLHRKQLRAKAEKDREKQRGTMLVKGDPLKAAAPTTH